VDPAGAVDRLSKIAGALPPGRRVQVGAEDSRRTGVVLSCVLDVAGRGLADRLGGTVQADLLGSPGDADALAAAGVHVHLVKSAYVETAGVHAYGEATDVAYVRLGFPPGRAAGHLVDGHARRSAAGGAADGRGTGHG